MCEICGKEPCDNRCPNYVMPNSNCKCEYCGDPIIEDEEYVSNSSGEYMHYDCLFGLSTRRMLEWFGHDVEVMGGDDEDY
jgi:predicted nucleic acid-binding Zn ribbon protein